MVNNMKRRRLIRWILPQIQGRALLLLAMTGCSTVLVNSCVLAFVLGKTASYLPNDGELFFGEMGTILLTGGVFTLLIGMPAVMFLGAAALMPLVGPLYHFHQFLKEVDAGRDSKEVRLREKDSFHDIAALLNRVTAARRKQVEKSASGAVEMPQAA